MSDFVSKPLQKDFFCFEGDIPDVWQMPQGGINENEDPKSAVMRELREEIGVTSADMVAEAPYWLTYDFPPDIRVKLNRQWGTDWKGQAQKWFLLKFTGKDEEVNLLGDGPEKPEFGQWSWIPRTQSCKCFLHIFSRLLNSRCVPKTNFLQIVAHYQP